MAPTAIPASRWRACAWCALCAIVAFAACASFDGAADSFPAGDAGDAGLQTDSRPEAAADDAGTPSDASSDSDAADAEPNCPCAVVIGGFHRDGGAPVVDDETFVARIAPNGTLEPWRIAGRLPSTTHGHAAGVDSAGRIHVLGGAVSGVQVNRVSWTALPPDGGSFGAYSNAATPLARAFSHGATATAAGWSFVTGGFDGPPHAVVQSALLDGPNTAFASTTALPEARTRHAAAIGGGVLYVIAGTFDGDAIVGNVVFARVDGGAVTTWTDGGEIPSLVYGQGVYGSCAVYVRGSIYLIGGSLSGNEPLEIVSRSVADPATGAPGPWTAVSPLPKPRMYPACAVHGDRIYVFGGWDSASSETADVHFATVAADGSLSGWTATTPLPESRGEHAAVIVP